MKARLVLYLLVICVTGCVQTKDKEAKIDKPRTIDVSKWELGNSIPDSMIEDVEFQPLETNEECLLGEAFRIECTDSLYYIMCGKYTNHVFVFNKTGKFLRKIGFYGRGEGEYLNLSDFDVDETVKELFIASLQDLDVVCFTLRKMGNGF